jgi:hypothetical protein
MSVKLHLLRKQAIVEYGPQVKGRVVACSASKVGGELIEKKDTPNTGAATFSFGASFSGDVYFHFQGSAGGVDEGPVTIP